MQNEAYWIPGPWSGRLGIVPRPRGGDWLADDVRAWRRAGIDVVASLLTPDEERELALEEEAVLGRNQGIEFHGLPIPDRGVPPSRSTLIDLVHRLEQALRAGKSVGVHCRQGIGRSSLLAASLLVSAGETSEDAFRAIEEVRGVEVPETAEQRSWVEELEAELVAPRS